MSDFEAGSEVPPMPSEEAPLISSSEDAGVLVAVGKAVDDEDAEAKDPLALTGGSLKRQSTLTTINGDASKPEVRFCKFQLKGLAGAKTAVLIPENMRLDAKLAKFIFTTLKLNQPNLCIEGISGTFHPLYMLTKDELKSPGVKTLWHNLSPDDFLAVRECLMLKIKGIVDAIVSACEQTESATYTTSWSSFEGFACQALRKAPTVMSIVSVFANDGIFCDERTQDLFSALDEKAAVLNEDNVTNGKGSAGELIAKHLVFRPDEKAFETHAFMDTEKQVYLPPDEIQHVMKGPFPDATVWFISHLPNDVKTREQNQELWVTGKTAVVEDKPLEDCSILGPRGAVIMGGRTAATKRAMIEAIQKATPTVIVNHSGGQANVLAEVIKMLVAVIGNETGALAGLADEDSIDSATSMEMRIGIINPSLMRNKALARSSGSPDILRKMPNQFTVSEILLIIDQAKGRPKVFTDTLKVVDPILHTPEACLERLSSCFCSTYTGTEELGCATAQLEVVMEAWRIHKCLTNVAKGLGRRFAFLTVLAAVITFCSVCMSVFAMKLNECEVNEADRTWICTKVHLAQEGMGLGKFQDVINTLLVALPAFSAAMAAIVSTFMYGDKWSAASAATVMIVREIYFFRAAIGPYSTSGVPDEEEEGEGEGEAKVSPAALAKRARTLFVKKINAIDNGLSHTELKLHGIERVDDRDRFCEDDLPVYLNEMLYKEDVKELKRLKKQREEGHSRKKKSKFPCCQRRRHQTDVHPEAGFDGAMEAPAPAPAAEEGEVSATPILDGSDDCLSAITAEAYFAARTMKLKKLWMKRVPVLHRRDKRSEHILFFLSLVAALLGAFEQVSFMPIVLGLSAFITTLIQFAVTKAQLQALTYCLTGIRAIEREWYGMSNVERRTPKTKARLIEQTELLADMVSQAAIGVRASSGEGGEGGDDGGNEDDGKKKKKGKKKE